MSQTTVEPTTLRVDAGRGSQGGNAIMQVTPGAGGTYIWIGDDEACFGTFGPGKAQLRRLRDALNVALGEA